MQEQHSVLLDPKEAARFLGMKNPGTLGNWRTKGRGPVYVKIGTLVRYRIEDLEEYVQRHRVQVPAERRR